MQIKAEEYTIYACHWYYFHFRAVASILSFRREITQLYLSI
jgi:hypothetical protein